MSAPGLTANERVERVRMALAEAGYPNAGVEYAADDHGYVDADVPSEVIWRAVALVETPTVCWPCYEADPFNALIVAQCDHDPATSPQPPKVSR